MITLREMSVNDVHLRYLGTWVGLQVGTKVHTMYVTDAAVEQRKVGEYYDTDVLSFRGVVGGQELLFEPTAMIPEPSKLGYVELRDELLFLSRTPERQSRAGLPPHSLRVYHAHELSARLSEYSSKDSWELVDQLFKQSRKFVSLSDAVKLGHGMISHELCYNGNQLFGPEFLPLGEVSVQGEELCIITEHPKTVQRLLGEAHANGR